MKMTDIVTSIDAGWCSELLRRAGDELHGLYLRRKADGPPPQEIPEAVASFREIDESVTGMLRAELATRYPGIPWSDAEFDLEAQHKQNASGGEYWVCDVLDGAFHFFQGFPDWTITLCLMSRGRPAYAAVYDPCQGELFCAVHGGGAFLNGVRMVPGRKRELAASVVATALPTPISKEGDIGLSVQSIGKVSPKALMVRMMGSVSLQMAYVACGRLDAFWEYGEDLHDWLAGILLVQESGGMVTGTLGEAFHFGVQGIITGNAAVHAELVKTLNA